MKLLRKVQAKDIARSRKRHLLKTITWRVVATLTTFSISYALTKSISVGLEIASVEFFAKMLLYYFHERVWFKINVE